MRSKKTPSTPSPKQRSLTQHRGEDPQAPEVKIQEEEDQGEDDTFEMGDTVKNFLMVINSLPKRVPQEHDPEIEVTKEVWNILYLYLCIVNHSQYGMYVNGVKSFISKLRNP